MSKSSQWKWGTVTAIGPVRVRLDGEASALQATPQSLVQLGSLKVGQRVRVHSYGRDRIIIGVDQTTSWDLDLVTADLTSPFTIRSGYGFKVNRRGDVVYMQAQFTTTGAFSSGATVLAVGKLPTWARPSVWPRVIPFSGGVAVTSTGMIGNFEVKVDGSMMLHDVSDTDTAAAIKLAGSYVVP